MPDTSRSRSAVSLNTAKAVMPNGSLLDRAAVLRQLGLDPSAPPDAWLTIAACGSNASALTTEQLTTLERAGKLDIAQLDTHSRARLGR